MAVPPSLPVRAAWAVATVAGCLARQLDGASSSAESASTPPQSPAPSTLRSTPQFAGIQTQIVVYLALAIIGALMCCCACVACGVFTWSNRRQLARRQSEDTINIALTPNVSDLSTARAWAPRGGARPPRTAAARDALYVINAAAKDAAGRGSPTSPSPRRADYIGIGPSPTRATGRQGDHAPPPPP